MKSKIVLAIVLLCLTFVACEKEELKTREVYRSRDLKIEFKDYSDSRCPLNTNCIWAGEAEVYLEAKSGNETAAFFLTGIGDDTTVFGHKVELIDLLPFPESGVQVAFKDKEVQLRVSKL